LKEFELIKRFFKNNLSYSSNHSNQSNQSNKNKSNNASNVLLDIGDDCAVLDIKDFNNLLVTSDTLISGTHFLIDAPAKSIAHKSLAVSLSDIAAMGATPKWVMLNVALHKDFVNDKNDGFIEEFAQGFFELANLHNVKLIGGDTTSIEDKAISITVTVLGVRDGSNEILTRCAAKKGDGIFITGSLGAATFILDKLLNGDKELNNISLCKDRINNLEPDINKLYYPTPRVEAGMFINKYATSCIDSSDGFMADLTHILNSSKLSAEVYLHDLPLNNSIGDAVLSNMLTQDMNKFYDYVLTGGDEYELIFTAPMKYKDILENYLDNNKTKITYIGNIVESIDDTDGKIFLLDKDYKLHSEYMNKYNKSNNLGWEHFS